MNDSLQAILGIIDLSHEPFGYRWNAAQRDKTIFQQYVDGRISIELALKLFIANNMSISTNSIDIDDFDIDLEDFRAWIGSLGY